MEVEVPLLLSLGRSLRAERLVDEGLELAALLVRLSTFLGRPLGRLAAPGAMIGRRNQVKEV